MVGTQIPGELHVEVADGRVLVLAARNSANGVDPRCRVRTIIQVHSGQAKVRCINHGLIESLQHTKESLGTAAPWAVTRPGNASRAASAPPITVLLCMLVGSCPRSGWLGLTTAWTVGLERFMTVPSWPTFPNRHAWRCIRHLPGCARIRILRRMSRSAEAFALRFHRSAEAFALRSLRLRAPFPRLRPPFPRLTVLPSNRSPTRIS